MSDLISHLIDEPYKYGLFQAISLLERYVAQTDLGDGERVNGSVQFKSHVSLAFPSADIHSIRQDENDPNNFQVFTPMVSLAGGTGPLPQVFTEMLLNSRKNKDTAPLDFLDIFNHRLISLFYQLKQKYHLALGRHELKQMPILKFVDAAASLGSGSAALDLNHSVWLRHASLQGPAPRSMEGLISVLRDRLGISFKSSQFFGIWLKLDVFDHAALGAHPLNRKKTQLGLNATLGQRAWDQSAAFLLSTRSLSQDTFSALLPTEKLHQRLKWLVNRHQSSPRQVCVELSVDANKFKPLALGQHDGPKLGLSSWILGPMHNTPSSIRTVTLAPCRFWLRDAHQHDQVNATAI